METLKDLRRAAKLTQASVAAALNVRQQAVASWESGTNRPALEKLQPLASLYGCTLEAVVDAIVGKEAPAHANSIPPA